MRAALVVIFAAFGYAKWFDYEAQGLVPLIGLAQPAAELDASGVRHPRRQLCAGRRRVGFGLLLLAGFWSRRLGLLGAIGSTVTYLTTLTLIFFPPGARSLPPAVFRPWPAPPAIKGSGICWPVPWC
ncbi:YkgB family protein [Serratia ureilytica]